MMDYDKKIVFEKARNMTMSSQMIAMFGLPFKPKKVWPEKVWPEKTCRQCGETFASNKLFCSAMCCKEYRRG